jgi:REP element-mobilizing transposase RayT
MPQSLACVLVHAVFSTKHRQPHLADPACRQEMHAYIGGVSKKLECPPIVTGGVEDHVHCLFHLGRTVSIADWIKEVKRVSSTFGKRWDPGFSWQAGYGAFSVDPLNLDRVANYIRRQEEHHRTESFQEEFLRLLEEHGLEWDERYVWD